MFGHTVGDKLRLGDTSPRIEVENDAQVSIIDMALVLQVRRRT